MSKKDAGRTHARRADLSECLIDNTHSYALLKILELPAKDRPVPALIFAAKDLAAKTPLEEIPLLIAALAAHVPACEFKGAKSVFTKKTAARTSFFNDIHQKLDEQNHG
jgi:hypothetical protein